MQGNLATHLRRAKLESELSIAQEEVRRLRDLIKKVDARTLNPGPIRNLLESEQRRINQEELADFQEKIKVGDVVPFTKVPDNTVFEIEPGPNRYVRDPESDNAVFYVQVDNGHFKSTGTRRLGIRLDTPVTIKSVPPRPMPI
jgi:hypothetical protein